MSWSDKETQILFDMYHSGEYTYQQMADELADITGKKYTFNSVRNKIRRTKPAMKTEVTVNAKPFIDALKGAKNALEYPEQYMDINVNKPKEFTRNDKGEVNSSFVSDFSTEDLQDDNKILEVIGLDPKMYEIQNVKVGNWEQNSNENGMKTLHSIKVTAKRRTGISDESLIETLVGDVKPFVSHETFDNQVGYDYNLVIPLADLHFGITKLDDLSMKLLSFGRMMKNKKYKVVSIEQLGDLFHSSLMKTTQTQKGTILDDVDMVQAIEDAKTFFDAIIRCSLQHAKEVHIYHTEGNHSGNMEYMFLEYLKAKYPDVKVFNNNDYRYFYALDNVGFMIAHGDYAKKNLPMLFANEASQIWSDSYTREIHTGHFHSEKTVDHDGVIHRQLGTMKPNDKYEISNGWVLSKKELQIFEYDKNRLVTTYNL